MLSNPCEYSLRRLPITNHKAVALECERALSIGPRITAPELSFDLCVTTPRAESTE